MSEKEGRRRRQRSDARRSSSAVLDATLTLLGERQAASVEDIATAAGVSRQTVYAHYPTREALLRAANTQLTSDIAVMLDALPENPGLGTWLAAVWEVIERYPILLSPAIMTLPPCEEIPLTERMAVVLRQAKGSGDLDPALSETWLVGATIGLAHAARAEVTGGRMSTAEAGIVFRQAVLAICTPGD